MDYLENLKKLIKVKQHLDRALYNGHSLVTYDLLLRILESHLNAKRITIKEVCTQSSQSVLNTRKHLDYLIKHDWVVIVKDTKDRRQKLLQPSQKLKNLINEVGKHFFE